MDDTDSALYLETVENTGTIYVGASLDRETMAASGDIYTLWISVNDGKHERGPVLIKVKVLDVNDNPPVFPQTVYSFQASEVSLSRSFWAWILRLSNWKFHREEFETNRPWHRTSFIPSLKSSNI